jgi:hypothetical protein
MTSSVPKNMNISLSFLIKHFILFKNIFLYKRSNVSNSVTRKALTGNYRAKNYERVVLETTIENPITIIDNN